jgi:hypothetical protein
MVIDVAVITPLLFFPVTEMPMPAWSALEVAELFWIIFVLEDNVMV